MRKVNNPAAFDQPHVTLSLPMNSIFTTGDRTKNMMKSLMLLVISFGSFCLSAYGASAPPAIFYSDLQSGPNTGGENNNGAYVTIYGKRFGTSQGASYVTVGSGKAVNYKLWTDTKVTFQLGGSATSGNVTITNSSGTSNGVPFTVRAGAIYFVSTSGNDSNSGAFASPWRSIPKAKDSLSAGTIAYLMNGVAQTAVDNYNADLSIQSAGTASTPIALVAYPGATVTIGNNSANYGIRTPAISGGKDYWVLAGINFRGLAAMDLVGVTGWRVVGNDFSCPNGSGQSACVHTDTTTNLKFYGNYVHNVGDAAGSIDKYYHAVYFTTNSNSIDAGWNTVVPNPTHSTKSGGCRAIQFYSTGGSDQYDLHVHDNVVHDAVCDGINFSTVNPDNGTVEAYNNLVYHVGTGPDPYNGSSNYACIVLNSSSSSPRNPADVYNNTLYDCGSRGTSDAGALALGIPSRLRNNVVRATGTEAYLAPSWNASCTTITGTNNLWYGGGTAPSCTTSNVIADPLFANAGGDDFHLQATSPAKDHGTTVTTLKTDLEGIRRPQGAAYDIGAYEYFQSSTTATNPCDLNADGVVTTADVQIAISQVLRVSACGTADLQRNGTCTVVDVQRVVNSYLGQTCRTGP